MAKGVEETATPAENDVRREGRRRRRRSKRTRKQLGFEAGELVEKATPRARSALRSPECPITFPPVKKLRAANQISGHLARGHQLPGWEEDELRVPERTTTVVQTCGCQPAPKHGLSTPASNLVANSWHLRDAFPASWEGKTAQLVQYADSDVRTALLKPNPSRMRHWLEPCHSGWEGHPATVRDNSTNFCRDLQRTCASRSVGARTRGKKVAFCGAVGEEQPCRLQTGSSQEAPNVRGWSSPDVHPGSLCGPPRTLIPCSAMTTGDPHHTFLLVASCQPAATVPHSGLPAMHPDVGMVPQFAFEHAVDGANTCRGGDDARNVQACGNPASGLPAMPDAAQGTTNMRTNRNASGPSATLHKRSIAGTRDQTRQLRAWSALWSAGPPRTAIAMHVRRTGTLPGWWAY